MNEFLLKKLCVFFNSIIFLERVTYVFKLNNNIIFYKMMCFVTYFFYNIEVDDIAFQV